MLRKEPNYVDNLYSNYHLQMGNEELLLPIQPVQPQLAYPTALPPPQQQPQQPTLGMVTHIEPFQPSNFTSSFKKLAEQRKVRSAPSAPRVLSDLAPPGASLYEATYSGVEVYEMVFGDNSLMRRRDDSWVNATHILKIAGIEKGKRTKILEKELVNERHEKIQGGYGKYQGTWVPVDVAKMLAKQFNVYEYCRPILDL